ncbi:Ankyrin repeat-containing domain [Cordyceps militaris]|uniref:Ankyrin repeat-containing domain n=1 Tax=Cordyceps militaris TaxID=73501 RepID=A0A2H4SU52_CORMI|nr:Ankyrin repeat-containing domain [Cordyceps militaris]
MATPLQFTDLVDDVFYMILGYLDTADILALSRSCRRLHSRLEPCLFRDELSCDRALRWACCKDLPTLVRRAVAGGGHVSAPIRKVKKYAWDSMVFRTLSLRIAAKFGSLGAFRALLDLGATTNVQLPKEVHNNRYEYLHIDDEISSLAKSLSMKRHAALLKVFVESDAATTMPLIDGTAFLDQCLLNALRSGASFEAVECLLQNGASPARLQSERGNNPCPLALAVIWNRPVVDLLCRFGATMEGKAIPRNLGLKWFHIPIFAAARQMHEHGTEVVQSLLDAGTRANHCADVSVRGGRRKPLSLESEFRLQESDKQTNMYSSCAPMPIYIYLDSITSWESNQRLPPTEGLKFWLKNGLDIEAGLPLHQMPPRCCCVKQKLSTLYSFITAKWTWQTHLHDEYFHVLDMLTEVRLGREAIPAFKPKRCISGEALPDSPAARHAIICNKQMLLCDEEICTRVGSTH